MSHVTMTTEFLISESRLHDQHIDIEFSFNKCICYITTAFFINSVFIYQLFKKKLFFHKKFSPVKSIQEQ